MDQQTQSVFRTAALTRYPKATLCGDGAYGVILNDGRITIELFPTMEEASRFAGRGFRVEYFGPAVRTRPFRHRMDREED